MCKTVNLAEDYFLGIIGVPGWGSQDGVTH